MSDTSLLGDLFLGAIRDEIRAAAYAALTEALSEMQPREPVPGGEEAKRTRKKAVPPPAYAMAYTPGEAASVLRIGVTKMRELMKSGQIPSFKDGGIVRIRRTALEEYMRAKEQGGQPWHGHDPLPIVEEVFGELAPNVAPITRAGSSGGRPDRSGPRRSR